MTVKHFYKRVIPYIYVGSEPQHLISDELQNIWNQMEDDHRDLEYLDQSQERAGYSVIRAIQDFQEKIDVLNARIDELETELYGESE